MLDTPLKFLAPVMPIDFLDKHFFFVFTDKIWHIGKAGNTCDRLDGDSQGRWFRQSSGCHCHLLAKGLDLDFFFDGIVRLPRDSHVPLYGNLSTLHFHVTRT